MQHNNKAGEKMRHADWGCVFVFAYVSLHVSKPIFLYMRGEHYWAAVHVTKKPLRKYPTPAAYTDPEQT